jgi:hypothetical protein
MAKDIERALFTRDSEIRVDGSAYTNEGVAELSMISPFGKAATVLTVGEVKTLHRYLTEIIDRWEGVSVG